MEVSSTKPSEVWRRTSILASEGVGNGESPTRARASLYTTRYVDFVEVKMEGSLVCGSMYRVRTGDTDLSGGGSSKCSGSSGGAVDAAAVSTPS